MDVTTKLIVGLGNPGKEYEKTRHNIGFAVVEEFARRNAILVSKREHQALVGEGFVEGNRIFLLKPQTYMNLSGQSVAAFLRLKPLALTEIIVVTDDIALPLGKLRLRAEGSAGGHNGLKSLIQHLHSQSFPRLRFGVGAPRDAAVQVDFVLGQFNRREQAEVDEAAERAVDALETWAGPGGLEQAMQKFNG